VSNLTFLGAAGTVTGSKHLVENGGQRFLLDCGLFQGSRDIEVLNALPLPFAPATLAAVIVTHGHLDHVGYLPKLVRDGYRGRIYCTPATAGVMQIVLEDAANLQEHLTARGFHHQVASRMPFLYDRRDVATTMECVQTIPLESPWAAAGATFRFHDAGHILGAAYVEALVSGTRLVFSGDLGRYGTTLLRDPAPLGEADVIVCESTYGDRHHEPDADGAFHRILTAALARGGPIILPAFAVERTQSLLVAIGMLQRKDPALATVPVHVDSPMAARVNDLFSRFPEAHKAIAGGSPEHFGCRNLRVHVTSAESKELNHLAGPAIVIASSGMANGGRVLYHLHRRLTDPDATIVFAGYQVEGTLGRSIVDGAKQVRIFGDRLAVLAQIEYFDGFSAHADQSELLRWLATRTTKPRFYAVHGEPQAAQALCEAVHQRLGLDTVVATRGLTIEL
jgi:metallo-beta-lactamase family protein